MGSCVGEMPTVIPNDRSESTDLHFAVIPSEPFDSLRSLRVNSAEGSAPAVFNSRTHQPTNSLTARVAHDSSDNREIDARAKYLPLRHAHDVLRQHDDVGVLARRQ